MGEPLMEIMIALFVICILIFISRLRYGLKHINSNDHESMQAGLDLLLNGMDSAAVLEIDTSGCENTKIFKNLFKALNKEDYA